MLQKINIADNQVNLNETENPPGLIKLMCEVMQENTSLIHYNFRFNILRDEGNIYTYINRWVKNN